MRRSGGSSGAPGAPINVVRRRTGQHWLRAKANNAAELPDCCLFHWMITHSCLRGRNSDRVCAAIATSSMLAGAFSGTGAVVNTLRLYGLTSHTVIQMRSKGSASSCSRRPTAEVGKLCLVSRSSTWRFVKGCTVERVEVDGRCLCTCGKLQQLEPESLDRMESS